MSEASIIIGHESIYFPEFDCYEMFSVLPPVVKEEEEA